MYVLFLQIEYKLLENLNYKKLAEHVLMNSKMRLLTSIYNSPKYEKSKPWIFDLYGNILISFIELHFWDFEKDSKY